MKANDIVKCPHCGETTPAKAKQEIVGWQAAGEILLCAFCGGKLGVPEKPAANGGRGAASAAADRLSALLGGETVEKTATLDGGDGYMEFCRHCRHFLWHPFVCRCAIGNKETDPGSYCDNFEAKTDDTGAKP